MSLNKAIKHHKEHRKPYKGAKAISRHCRNHGACGWCVGNRTYHNERRRQQYTDDPAELCIEFADKIEETIERGIKQWEKNQQKKKH